MMMRDTIVDLAKCQAHSLLLYVVATRWAKEEWVSEREALSFSVPFFGGSSDII